MPNYFTFGTVSSKNYGVSISGVKKYLVPERDYSTEPIPGTLGDVLLNGKSAGNIIIEYPCLISIPYGSYADLPTAFNAFKNALLSQNGYLKLSDTYDATHYYMAAFQGGVEADIWGHYEAAEFAVAFIAKPQRFLSSATTHTITAGNTTSITPDGKRGYPIFTLTGAGSFEVLVDGVVSETVTVSSNPFTNGIVIDCERKVCYDADDHSASGNPYVSFSNYQFPEINRFGGAMATTVGIRSTGLSGSVKVVWFEL